VPVEETTTYLEMTAPSDLRPSRPVPAVTVEPTEPRAPLIVPVQVRIGEPYAWPSVFRTAQEWAERLADPLRQYWLIRYHSELAGALDVLRHPEGEVEITTFGLVPEYVGRGVGGYALTVAVREAWNVEPLGADTVRRVWLHTSSLDHPHALGNYQRRGFRAYRRVTGPSARPPVTPPAH
jgi:GNAT superfamily N-acetyltransferase